MFHVFLRSENDCAETGAVDLFVFGDRCWCSAALLRAVTPDGCLCSPILGYSKFFVLFGVPRNDKSTNNSMNKLRFLMQNNVQFNIILV